MTILINEFFEWFEFFLCGNNPTRHNLLLKFNLKTSHKQISRIVANSANLKSNRINFLNLKSS